MSEISISYLKQWLVVRDVANIKLEQQMVIKGFCLGNDVFCGLFYQFWKDAVFSTPVGLQFHNHSLYGKLI